MSLCGWLVHFNYIQQVKMVSTDFQILKPSALSSVHILMTNPVEAPGRGTTASISSKIGVQTTNLKCLLFLSITTYSTKS